MVRFEQTSRVIADFEANIPRQAGMHTLPHHKVSVGGMDVGSIDFDPTRHLAHQIDPLSPMQDVFGVPQVRLQLPRNPLLVTVVGDYRLVGDSSEIQDMKSHAIDEIVRGITSAIPSLDLQDTYELRADKGLEDEKDLLELCSDGLCFIVGDFRRFRQDMPTFSDRADVVAIKVNHPAERALVPNAGTYSLGRGIEINSNDPRQLATANSALAMRHIERVRGLRRAGAVVGSVVMTPGREQIIDVESVDKTIACALEEVREKA